MMANLFESIVKQLLTESGNFGASETAKLELVDEGNPSKGFYLYHCAHKKDIKSLSVSGARRQYTGQGTGNLYGPGIYTTYTLKSSIYNAEEDISLNGWGAPHQLGSLKNGAVYDKNNQRIRPAMPSPKYGSQIVKLKCEDDPRDYLIFDKVVVKQLYGKEINPVDQIFMILKRHQGTGKLQTKCTEYLGNVYKGKYVRDWLVGDFYYKESYWYTRDGAEAVYEGIIKHLQRNYGIKKFIRGLIFSGRADGNVCVAHSFASCHPIAFSSDLGKTFNKIDTNNYIYKALANNVDLKNDLGDLYYDFRTEGFSSGYAVAQRDGKYRILSQELYKRNSNDGRITYLWFDEVYGISFDLCTPRKIKVVYNGTPYVIRKTPHVKGEYTVYDDLNMHYLCDLKDLERFDKELDDNQGQTNPQQSQQQQTDDFDFSDLEDMD